MASASESPERRVALFWVGREQFMCLVAGHNGRFIRPVCPNLPADAVIEDVHYDYARDCFAVRVRHPSFHVVGDGEPIPWVDRLEIEVQEVAPSEGPGPRIKIVLPIHSPQLRIERDVPIPPDHMADGKLTIKCHTDGPHDHAECVTLAAAMLWETTPPAAEGDEGPSLDDEGVPILDEPKPIRFREYL